YTVQTASFQQVENAQKMVEALKKKGFSPFITPAQISTGKIWYRVMLGNFSSREEAKRIARKVQDSMDIQPMIISLKKSDGEAKTP
ncbi:MAG: SPOR domain-containing protein, partial [Proteobacteria bacterium]|nr:SPOR domain-containing protein [Pseudomonadota bacterium]